MKGTKKTNVLGLLGIITFIAAELFFALHSKSIVFVFIGGLFVLTAFILSIIGLKKKPRVLPIISLVLSGLEILAAFVFGLIILIGVVSKETEETALTVTGTINGHDYVDLGLSVKWATCNVGATKPEEYGDYYAWGETETKDTYNGSTYKWVNGSSTLTKYHTVDNKTVLDPEDDVAHVKWGGSWRMPTKAEQDELLSSCTWTWFSRGNTEFLGVAGYKVTSNKSGYTDRFIFMPAAGCRRDTSLDYAGEDGVYWSSSLGTDYPVIARGLSFSSGGHGTNDHLGRSYGHSVRPVCP